MLTLKQILESDSVSSLVAKVNLNFQQIAVSGGGPQGIPGEQGIPGLPGRQGPIGPTGMKGPTGSVVGLIPFASQTGGSTGPTGIAGPWNTYSYEYLNTYAGTGPNVVGNIWIDHWNGGYWQYLNTHDADIVLTESPYSHVAVGPNPPDGTGYYSTAGWYFYPSSNQGGGGQGGDVWTNDISTYQTAPPYERGAYSANSPLTVKNARLLSKYGTVWISSGNAIDNAGNTDQSNLTTPTIYDWDNPTAPIGTPTLSNPARYNAGVDRLYFKQSIDTLPYLSNVTARSYVLASGVPAGDPAQESIDFPALSLGSTPLHGAGFWVKPLYNPSLDSFSPLQFYTERRDSGNYSTDTVYGSLGLYSYSTPNSGKTFVDKNYRKSLWVYSTRASLSPDTSTGIEITPDDTFNIGEMLFDVRKLTASNQFICSLPQDIYLSSDYISSGQFTNAGNSRAHTVTQGYISSINGKLLTGADVENLDIFNYGDLTNNDGNTTRSSWYGSAAMFTPSNWDYFDSDIAEGNTDDHFIDKTYRFAGMRERAKKSYNAGETYFLNELIFYTSQFQLGAGNATASSANVNLKANAHKSLGGLYLSPFRNVGIGTFPSTESGVFEPIARLHIHTFIRGAENDGGDIKVDVGQRNFTSQYVSRYTLTPWADYPANMYKGGALTLEDTTSAYLDFYLGHLTPPTNESSNSLASNNTPNTRPNAILDAVIRRESWQKNDISTEAAILRLGVSPVKHALNGNFNIGQDAPSAKYDFQIALSPLNPMAGYPSWDSHSPVGVGIHNLYPRARFHLYGKNLQNEGLLGNEPASPGYAAAAGTTAVDGYYPWSNYSGSQVIIDKLEQTWTYNPGYREYPYEAFGVVNLTNAAANASTPATGTSGSPNAANFPVWERSHPTRNVLPWSPLTRNYAAFAEPTPGYRPGSAQNQGIVYMHGEQYQNLFAAKSYMGFNLFRDLLNVGDDIDNTRWRLGTEGDNGGSAIITSTAGDMVFVNIKTGRDGGLQYRPFEQQGLSTRDVLNNVSLVLTASGDMGIGAQPGFDYNTFTSLERFSYNGYVNYVSFTGDARVSYTSQVGIMGTGTGTNKPYGLINYSGLSATYPETMSVSSAAAINANASQAEYIRFDVAAQKFYGKPSRSSLETGAGYPTQRDIIITGAAVRNYLLIDWAAYTTAGGICDRLIIATDFEGRIWYVTIQNQSGSAPFVDPRNYGFRGLLMPHPTEFNVGGPLAYAADPGWVAPSGAAAGIMNPGQYWQQINTGLTGSWGIPNTNFENSPIGKANMRLNNFVAGEGMNPATEQDWVRTQVKQARQQSPKLIFTFLEADNTTIPGTKAINTSETIGTNRPISGTAAYRKVNTVIASAQNESSLREYWIPKSDNTGGTFMVWTDHYGKKEYESGLDVTTVASSRFYVEEVIALEFVPSYTGVTSGNEFITNYGPGNEQASLDSNNIGKSGKDYPLHVKYYNSLMGVPKYGITGTTNNAFLPNQYGKKVDLFGQPLGVGPISQFTYEDTSAGSLALSGTDNVVTKINTVAVSVTGTYSVSSTSLLRRTTIITLPSITLSGGKDVLLTASGPVFESSAAAAGLQFFRGAQPIGAISYVDVFTLNVNMGWSHQCVDINPPAGTHVYTLKAVPPRLGTNIFGDAANLMYPSASAIEIGAGTITSTGGGAVGTTAGYISGTGATGLALLRNVDKYYSLISNNTNWDNNWNSGTGPGSFTNDASQFRFKRINSDMALVDFNMTIRVTNPEVTNGYQINTSPEWYLIDGGSPRWTQYIRLAYLPTLNSGPGSADNNYFMKLFGNSLSFMNWSSFNQWYPGTAISSDASRAPAGNLNITPGDSLSTTGGPNYTMNTTYDPGHTQNLVWSGNFYDATMSSNVAGTIGDYTRGQILGNPGTTTDTYSHSNITPFYGNSFYNAGISKMLIWDDPNGNDPNYSKSLTFGKFMGKSYSILGNDYLSKVRNCTWRIVPRIGTAHGNGEDLASPTNIKNNSFALEFMFDKPILHIDTPFAKYNFSSTTDTDPCYPYQYLTVSGQAMVRYSDATNTTFGGPTTVLSGTVQGGSTGPGPTGPTGPAPIPLAVGDFYEGGIIGYIYGPGDGTLYTPGQQNGIIVALPSGIGTSRQWGCNGVAVGASWIGLGQSTLNTLAINAGCSSPSTPAAYCTGYVDPLGYTDWLLPNDADLEKCRLNRAVGNMTSIPANIYWTSVEYSFAPATTAVEMTFTSAGAALASKTSSRHVLPIRYF